ncbi:MAG: hypothetical protein ACFUZC_14550 [Chthoniobacteraceae bacterium]
MATAPDAAGGIAAVKALKIEAAEMTFAERNEFPTMTLPDGKTLDNQPPRVMVKMVLHPAPGSHINVELWMPDTGKWNGRFLGFGNGGAAGNINPRSFATPLNSVMPWRQRTWERRRTPIPESEIARYGKISVSAPPTL